MAKTSAVNATASGAWQYGNAGGDAFAKEDVQNLGANFDLHDHTSTKGKSIGTTAIATDAVTQVGYTESAAAGNTASVSLVDLPNLTTTITTTGGDLYARVTVTCSNTNVGNITDFTLNLDSATETLYARMNQQVANAQTAVTYFGRFTSVGAGSHTIKARWKVSAGTTTIDNTATRVIEVWERKR